MTTVRAAAITCGWVAAVAVFLVDAEWNAWWCLVLAAACFGLARAVRPKPVTQVTMHGSHRGLLIGDTVLHGGHRYRVLKVDGTTVTWQKLGGTRLT